MHAAIIRAGTFDLRPLAEVCQEVGVGEAVVLSNPIGDSFIDPARPQPDFVIGVLNPADEPQVMPTGLTNPIDPVKQASFTNLDVMLRVGMTCERGIPTFLVVPPPLSAPRGPTSLVVAACPFDDRESLRLHLWAFTATLAERRTPAPPRPAEVRPVDVKRLKQSLHPGGQASITGFQLEQLVATLLQQAGIAFAEDPAHLANDQGFDLAVLPSRLSDDVVFVEVKAGKLTEQRLREAELQLQNLVVERRSPVGLLIYHDRDGRRFPAARPAPLVARIALEDLIERLGTQDFLQVLTEELSKATERI